MLASMRRETLQDLPAQDDDIPPPAHGEESPQSPESNPGGLESPLYREMHATHQWTMNIDEVLDFDIDLFVQRVYNIADDMGGQIVSAILDHIRTICEQNGQVIVIGDNDIFDAYIDAFETMDVDFDEDGQPKIQINTNPATLAEINKKAATPEQEERLRLVTERKRKDWLAARRRRELP